MTRANEFSASTKREARLRQAGRWGCCGDDLTDLEEHAHHLIPVSAGGGPDADNCVVLCDACHARVHYDGRFRSGIVAPPSYFPFFRSRR
jgi:5-methylcytosine-specific restriction endonuclease McrA